jgi:hypothetical protein
VDIRNRTLGRCGKYLRRSRSIASTELAAGPGFKRIVGLSSLTFLQPHFVGRIDTG